MVRAALTMFSALTALFTGSSCTATAQDLDAARQRMVDTQLRARRSAASAVLAAMAPRAEAPVRAAGVRERAYDNTPLPIGLGQTISQPFIVAYMTEMLPADARTHGAGDRHGVGLPGSGPGGAGA